MIEELIINIDNIVLGFVQNTYGNLSSTVATLWRLMFIIFIAVFGYKVIISGRFQASNLIVNTLKIIIILVLATQWDNFLIVIYNMTTDLPSDIAGVLMQGVNSAGSTLVASDQVSANAALSTFFDRAMEVNEQILEGAGWVDFGKYFFALLVWLAAMLFTGYAAMLIILAKLAVAILLAIAPLFILLLIFANTKSLFDGWLRTLLNYAVIPIFVYAVLALMLTISEKPLQMLEADAASGSGIWGSIAVFFFSCAVSMMLLTQVMSKAASITGGISLSTMGAAAMAGRFSSRTLRASPNAGFKGLVHGHSALRHPVKTAKVGHARIREAIKKTRGF